MKTLHATAAIDPPSNEFEAAALMCKVQPHWQTFIVAVEADGIKLRSDIATSETKTAPRANGEAPRKRGRRAQTPVAPEETAARSEYNA